MSDIDIRFDGLLLAGLLALCASIYLVVAAIAAIARLMVARDSERSRRTARTAFLLGLFYAAGLGAVLLYMSRVSPPAAGPDWIDWLTIPALVAFVAGCVVLARRKPPLH